MLLGDLIEKHPPYLFLMHQSALKEGFSKSGNVKTEACVVASNSQIIMTSYSSVVL